ncbi:potassium channel family protein [Geminocystis sp. GBBB08]|uniref:potassium channel family protein n=1 Tax=Geminocystis sp. GBBB08 TaxID=2604140 RepID=UPI0027E2548C|nr:potassium channel family protein [Geminocystis sp. GBBB08]MBL1211036.1 two pore domain potassium channel family protein [Geminocystis sp. GBBB08]
MKISNKNKYTQLLVYLIVLFFFLPISEYSPLINFIFPLSFFFTIISAINTLNFSKKIITVFYLIAGLSCLTDLMNMYFQSYLDELLAMITTVFDCIFLIFSIITISQKINVETTVNNDVIRGGICIYLMLGILWFLFYKVIYFFDVNAFHFPEWKSPQVNINLFYFSFVTLTTVGYGDITPINNYAMILSNLEALCGQLFPAIFIGILVSLYKK